MNMSSVSGIGSTDEARGSTIGSGGRSEDGDGQCDCEVGKKGKGKKVVKTDGQVNSMKAFISPVPKHVHPENKATSANSNNSRQTRPSHHRQRNSHRSSPYNSRYNYRNLPSSRCSSSVRKYSFNHRTRR